jgi:hypothetical protein
MENDIMSNKHLFDIYDNEIIYSNNIIKEIIDATHDFNEIDINDTNKLIKLSNNLLLSYILHYFNVNSIHDYQEAIDFIILSSIVSFWITYKFITNVNCIDVFILQLYSGYDYKIILEKELDILKSFDYNIYRFIM